MSIKLTPNQIKDNVLIFIESDADRDTFIKSIMESLAENHDMKSIILTTDRRSFLYKNKNSMSYDIVSHDGNIGGEPAHFTWLHAAMIYFRKSKYFYFVIQVDKNTASDAMYVLSAYLKDESRRGNKDKVFVVRDVHLNDQQGQQLAIGFKNVIICREPGDTPAFLCNDFGLSLDINEDGVQYVQ